MAAVDGAAPKLVIRAEEPVTPRRSPTSWPRHDGLHRLVVRDPARTTDPRMIED